ncbi:MAG TPA: NAD(P)-dependent oxidoreductase [Fibrobacteraceae bacterium]|nr:NAD(P)-dependent oxidoreductase [Fibrobacteraceae bacterium]
MILVTGGSGFFGGLLKERLLRDGHSVINVDLCVDEFKHPQLISLQGDIRDAEFMEKNVFSTHSITAVFHCAAILAHDVSDKNFLWTSNVDGTRQVAELAAKHDVRNLVFTSSNCLWGHNLGHLVREDEPPAPIEIYGKSKWEGEKILREYWEKMNVVIFRCPTIVEMGRLGLLAILFEFIAEGRKTWVVGGGDNRYQFIYAGDLIEACLLALKLDHSDLFHIGSDHVKTFREVYQHVIDHSKTKARVACLPRSMTLFAMRVAHKLGLSPLGPYQYNMIAESFVFDTAHIKEVLGWKPTLTNEEMLLRAYQYYFDNKSEIEGRTNASAHRRGAKMGIIRLLKWLS